MRQTRLHLLIVVSIVLMTKCPINQTFGLDKMCPKKLKTNVIKSIKETIMTYVYVTDKNRPHKRLPQTDQQRRASEADSVVVERCALFLVTLWQRKVTLPVSIVRECNTNCTCTYTCTLTSFTLSCYKLYRHQIYLKGNIYISKVVNLNVLTNH